MNAPVKAGAFFLSRNLLASGVMTGIASIAPGFPIALLGDIGGGEILVILGALLVLFGGRGMPEIARTLGRITRDLQRASQDFKNQLLAEDHAPAPGSPGYDPHEEHPPAGPAAEPAAPPPPPPESGSATPKPPPAG